MRRTLLAAALSILAASASADVTLLAPRAGDRLEGGSTTTLMWSATSLPSHANEWEAFLSVDGGAFYPVRITPHLDAGIRTFTWRVPNVATTRAKLLLRVGDETDEQVIELPQTFTIVPRAGTLDVDERHDDTRDNDGAIEWVSGDRHGGNLARHKRGERSASNTPGISAIDSLDDAVEVLSAECCVLSVRCERAEHSAPSTQHSALIVRPLLLLSTRLNV